MNNDLSPASKAALKRMARMQWVCGAVMFVAGLAFCFAICVK